MLVGIDDQGKILGVPNPDETMQRIVSAANSICKPPLRNADARDINTKCKPRQVETESAPITGELTPP
jgi:hypothetical protein